MKLRWGDDASSQRRAPPCAPHTTAKNQQVGACTPAHDSRPGEEHRSASFDPRVSASSAPMKNFQLLNLTMCVQVVIRPRYVQLLQSLQIPANTPSKANLPDRPRLPRFHQPSLARARSKPPPARPAFLAVLSRPAPPPVRGGSGSVITPHSDSQHIHARPAAAACRSPKI